MATSISQPRTPANLICGTVYCPLPPRRDGLCPIARSVAPIFRRLDSRFIGLLRFIRSDAHRLFVAAMV